MDFFLGFGYYETLLRTFTCMFSVDMFLFLLNKHLMVDLWSCDKHYVQALQKLPNFFKVVFITLSFHQQCMRVPASPHPYQQLALTVFCC